MVCEGVRITYIGICSAMVHLQRSSQGSGGWQVCLQILTLAAQRSQVLTGGATGLAAEREMKPKMAIMKVIKIVGFMLEWFCWI
jgi:hypothetical protein